MLTGNRIKEKEMIYILIVVAMISGSGNGSGADIEVTMHKFESAEACANVAGELTGTGRISKYGDRYRIEAFCVRDK